MSRRFQFSLVALMLLPTASCSPSTRAPGTYVYRLDGDYYDDHGQNAEPPANNLHGWPVLERKLVTDLKLAKELRGALENQENFENRNAVPGCFWPGLGIAIDEGEHSTEAVICLKCNYMGVYKDGTLSKKEFLTSRGHREFAELYAKSLPQQPKP